MSFEPREFLRHIASEAQYLESASAHVTRDQFFEDTTLQRAFVRSLSARPSNELLPRLASNLRTRPDAKGCERDCALRRSAARRFPELSRRNAPTSHLLAHPPGGGPDLCARAVQQALQLSSTRLSVRPETGVPYAASMNHGLFICPSQRRIRSQTSTTQRIHHCADNHGITLPPVRTQLR